MTSCKVLGPTGIDYGEGSYWCNVLRARKAKQLCLEYGKANIENFYIGQMSGCDDFCSANTVCQAAGFANWEDAEAYFESLQPTEVEEIMEQKVEPMTLTEEDREWQRAQIAAGLEGTDITPKAPVDDKAPAWLIPLVVIGAALMALMALLRGR